jgi:chemotaxis protein MotB
MTAGNNRPRRYEIQQTRRVVLGCRDAPAWPISLSTAHALALVKCLTAQSLPFDRLVANGLGRFQPLDPRETPEAFARNRRGELLLTNS